MSIDVTAIAGLLAQYPLGLMTAHHWFSDHPADTTYIFDNGGSFHGGDLPFGMIYEITSSPAGARYDWLESIVFSSVLGHVVNNARILGGYGSALPAEEFFLNRPRGILRFHEPTTTSISLDLVAGVECQLWGLYIDIPLITPTQMTFTPGGGVPATFPPHFDGSSGGVVTGYGTVLLDAGAIGVRLDVFGLPDSYGRDLVDPLIVFDLGWIQFGDATGWQERRRLEKEHQVFLSRAGVAVNRVSYALSAGVGATVTSLLPNE